MTGVLRFVRLSVSRRPLNLLDSTKKVSENVPRRFLASTSAVGPAKGSKLKALLVATAVGGSIGAAYSFYQRQGLKKAILNPEGEGLPVIWKEVPAHKVSRKVVFHNSYLYMSTAKYITGTLLQGRTTESGTTSKSIVLSK